MLKSLLCVNGGAMVYEDELRDFLRYEALDDVAYLESLIGEAYPQGDDSAWLEEASEAQQLASRELTHEFKLWLNDADEGDEWRKQLTSKYILTIEVMELA